MSEHTPDIPPQWAKQRADELTKVNPGFRTAFALYIAQHEEEPVDPRIGEEALKLISEWGASAGNVFVEACIRRGMELARSKGEV